MPIYEVKQNEDLRSIVYRECGTTNIADVLNHPDNKKLFLTSNEYLLRPGDKVTLPDTPSGIDIIVESGQRYILRPAIGRRLVIRIENRHMGPMTNTDYKLTVGETIFNGTTDENGLLRETVPFDSVDAKLEIKGKSRKLEIAGLDPIHTLRGIQGRLANLGHYRGALDGEFNEKTIDAIRAFQSQNGLKVDGRVGPLTRQELLDVHGC